MGDVADTGKSTGSIELSAAHSGVRQIAMTRPEKRNALTSAMATDLAEAIQKLDNDPAVQVIVLLGASGTFCAGADLNEMASDDKISPRERYVADVPMERLLLNLAFCATPIIGVVQGHAVGGGMAIASLCTYVVAASDAVFAMPEVSVGLFPAALVPYVATRVGTSRAVAWALSGRRVSTEQAYSAGLVDEVCNSHEVMERATALAAEMAGRSPHIMRAAMETRGRLMDLDGLTARRTAGRQIAALFWK